MKKNLILLTNEEAHQVANTTLDHLAGGTNGAAKIRAMLGASNLTVGAAGEVTFHFKSCRKANIVKIELNSLDLYSVTFYHLNKKTYDLKTVSVSHYIYNEDLKKYFEDFTGLYTSL